MANSLKSIQYLFCTDVYFVLLVLYCPIMLNINIAKFRPHPNKLTHKVAGVVLGLAALAHLYRAVTGTDLTYGTTTIPMWASWLAIVVAGYLSYALLTAKH